MGTMPCRDVGQRYQHMDRKTKKPLMEKRRRARINKCLNDLKNFLLDHLKRDASQSSKLEKADILEMTVHILKRMQQEQLMRATLINPNIRDRFAEGWQDCAAQVQHYINSVDGMPLPMKQALQKHLDERYRALQTAPSLPPALNLGLGQPGLVRQPFIPRPPFPAIPALNGAAFMAAAAAQQWRATLGLMQQQSHVVAARPAQAAPVHSMVTGTLERSSGTAGVSRRGETGGFPEPGRSLSSSTSDKMGPEKGEHSTGTPYSDISGHTVCAGEAETDVENSEDDDEDEEDDDAASCSSSSVVSYNGAKKESSKDNVWRPW